MYLCECQSMADADDHAVRNAVEKYQKRTTYSKTDPSKRPAYLIIVSEQGTRSEENVKTDLCTPKKTCIYQKRPNCCGVPEEGRVTM